MSSYLRVRRQQLMQEAEGYIDLAMCFHDVWALPNERRVRLADRAICILDQLDANHREDPRVLYLRGQSFKISDRHGDAIIPLQKANELDPENLHINLSLAWCYKRIGRIDLAISILEEALESSSDVAILHYNLACYWSLANHVGLTLIHLCKAFELDPCYREMVFEEPDFDTVRDHPEFTALTSVIV